MSDKEILDGIEKALDATEERLDQIIDGADAVVGRAPKPNLVHISIAAALGLVGGAAVSWFLAKKHFEATFSKLAEQEIAEAKAFYARQNKSGEFATPGQALEALSPSGVAASEALSNYQGHFAEPAVEATVTETVEVEVAPVITNVFTDHETDLVWDQDAELKKRELMDPDEPYILHKEEFYGSELDYHQQTLTYFAEDDVLVDEQEQPIALVDPVVGEGNLTRFGYGSDDNRIVYIRNDKLSMDFEIVKNDRSYTKEVLGLEHSDGPRVRKMRGGYE